MINLLNFNNSNCFNYTYSIGTKYGEIQYAPDLLRYIKIAIDNSEENAIFYLTGSQQFYLMKNVSESLAERIGILNLLGLSLREIKGIDFHMPFILTENYLQEHEKYNTNISYDELWNIIHKGTMLALYQKESDFKMFYTMYVNTYMERDVRNLTQIGNTLTFFKIYDSISKLLMIK